MTVLSYLYVILMYFAINVPGTKKNVVDGSDAAKKRYLKGGM